MKLPVASPGLSAPRPSQVEMDFLLAHCYPLIELDEAALLLACDVTTIENLVDDGTLPAVNLALCLKTRRMVRLWRWGVLHVCLQPERPMAPIAARDCMPHQRPQWTVHETATLFRCGHDHVLNLHADRKAEDGTTLPPLLTGPDLSKARPGVIRSRVRLDFSSIVSFLETRRIHLT